MEAGGDKSEEFGFILVSGLLEGLSKVARAQSPF